MKPKESHERRLVASTSVLGVLGVPVNTRPRWPRASSRNDIGANEQKKNNEKGTGQQVGWLYPGSTKRPLVEVRAVAAPCTVSKDPHILGLQARLAMPVIQLHLPEVSSKKAATSY